MMWRSWIVVLVSIVFAGSVYADDKEHLTKHVMIVLVPGFSYEETRLLEDQDHLFWRQTAMGVMNSRSNGPYSYLNNMVTISRGEKSVGIEGWNAFEKGEKFQGVDIDEWMLQVRERRRTAIYHPALTRLQEGSAESRNAGILGKLLKDAGVESSVYGHSDVGEELARYGSLLTMDDEGTAHGELTNPVKHSPSASYGKEMDLDYLLQELSTAKAEKQFTVVEWGDFHRLFKQRPFIEESFFKKKRDRELERLSTFLSRATKETNVDEIWVLAPMMHTEAYNNKQLLAPVYYWGERGDGFLTSQTTRQQYIVSNLDVVPTILHSFQIESTQNWQGNVMRIDKERGSKERFFNRVDEVIHIYKSRGSVLSTYITCLVLALSSAAILNLLNGKKKNNWSYWTRLLLLSALASPFLFLILSRAAVLLGTLGFVFVLLAASIGCGYIAEKVKGSPIAWLGFITFALLTVDLFLQTPFMKHSYLGYDPIIGARYYGIGNEFAGVYLVSALMSVHPLLASKRKWLVRLVCFTLLLFLVFILGKNSLGTNAGATLSAGIAFSYLLYRVFDLNWSWQTIAVAIGVGFAGILLLLYGLQMRGEPSHIGQAFQRLLTGDFTYIFELIKRKVSMNVKLFKHSNWTQLLVTSYVVCAIILWRKQLRLKRRDQQLFLQAGVVASFALLVLNDSGVVAAATSMFCVSATYYYWLSWRNEGKE